MTSQEYTNMMGEKVIPTLSYNIINGVCILSTLYFLYMLLITPFKNTQMSMSIFIFIAIVYVVPCIIGIMYEAMNREISNHYKINSNTYCDIVYTNYEVLGSSAYVPYFILGYNAMMLVGWVKKGVPDTRVYEIITNSKHYYNNSILMLISKKVEDGIIRL